MAITDYKTTTKFQEKDWFHPNPHSGTDYAIPLYTPLEAISDGIIVSISTNDLLGNNIRFKTSDGKLIVYGHLAEFKVKENQIVHKGDIIGLSGGVVGMKGSGRSSGPHLHLTVYENNGTIINPEIYLKNIEQRDDSSSLIFPLMIIILLFVLWKFKKLFLYGIAVTMGLFVIFIVS